MTTTPDFMMPLVGTRLWLVDPALHLRSVVFNNTNWPVRQPLESQHLQWPGAPGTLGHGPGIYSYKSANCLFADNEIRGLDRWLVSVGSEHCQLVGGDVSLWGTVEEHEEGFRARFAYPKEFVCVDSLFNSVSAVVGASMHVIEKLAHRYGVPVASEETHENWKTCAHRCRRAFNVADPNPYTTIVYSWSSAAASKRPWRP